MQAAINFSAGKSVFVSFPQRFILAPEYQFIILKKFLHMKKTIVMMGGILLSASMISAQVPETTPIPQTPEVKTWDAQSNPTVDSIRAK